MLEAGMAALQAKSQRLCQLFITLVDEMCGEYGLRLLSPTDPLQRGSHLAYAHPERLRSDARVIDRGVIGDFRAPDTLRFGSHRCTRVTKMYGTRSRRCATCCRRSAGPSLDMPCELP
jgi:kynureninase